MSVFKTIFGSTRKSPQTGRTASIREESPETKIQLLIDYIHTLYPPKEKEEQPAFELLFKATPNHLLCLK